MIKVIISGSRHSCERDIIMNIFNEYFRGDVQCYDCNEHITGITKEGKQKEINQRIRECDWYVLVANSVHYGEYTKMEWDTILDSLSDIQRDRIVTVVRCTNPAVSSHIQGVDDKGMYTFADFKSAMAERGIGEQFFLDYTFHDKEFASLKNVVRNEIILALSRNLVMRKHSIPLSEMRPEDVFANNYRILHANGFNEDLYLRRASVDDELDRSSGFTVVTGAPASGKTRAVYEYLKRVRAKEEDAGTCPSRLVKVNYDNLPALVRSVENIDEWRTAIESLSRVDLSEYYFVIDQIIDVLCDSEYMSLFNKLHRLAVERLNAKMLATSLIEPYKNLKHDPEFRPDSEEIRIPGLDSESDYYFKDNFNRIFGNEEDGRGPGQVIGDYIPGLKEYNESVIRSIEHSDLKNEIECFVKAFNLICMFRKGNVWPLGLVLAVAEKIYGREFDEALFKDRLLKFFTDNNILHIHSIHRYMKTSDLRIKHDTLYEYDGESLRIPVPAYYLIAIDNDYIWQLLRMQKYALDSTSQNDMDACIRWYCDAFLNEAPLATLRRVIVRSPAVGLALKYKANANFVKDFVIGRIHMMYEEGLAFNQDEMNELIAYVLHRSSSLRELEEDYEMFACEITRGSFALNETVVAEIMGFAQQLSSRMQKSLMEFLESKGWDFDTGNKLSIYYHRRIIEYMELFYDIDKYMTTHVLIPKVLNQTVTNQELDSINRMDVIKVIIRKCRCVSHVARMLEWIRIMDVKVDKDFFYDLQIAVRNNTALSNIKGNMKLLDLLDGFFRSGDFSTLLPSQIAYYLICLAQCFTNAVEIFTKYETELERNKPLMSRALSMMLDSAKKTEFAFIHRFFFRDGLLVRKMPQISRNRLLSNLDFTSAMTAFELMFDSSDADSTPDLYTLISLLQANLSFLKTAEYKTKIGKHVTELTYQNLLQILHHPYLKNIGRIDSTLHLIMQCCLSDSQEEYVIRNYVKPRYVEYLRTISGNGVSDAVLSRQADMFMEEKFLQREVVISKILRRSVTDMQSVQDYIIKVHDRLFRQGKAIKSDLLNSYCRKLFSLVTTASPEDKPMSLADYDRYRNDMKRYLTGRLRGNDEGTALRRLDYIIKDEFYYPAYYRLYPEDIVVKENGRYEIDSETFNSIPVAFITEKLISHILQGVALVMGENALKDIERWFISNLEDYQWNATACRLVMKLYPAYEFQTDRIPEFNEHLTYYKEKGKDEWQFLKDFITSSQKKQIKDTVKEFNRILKKISEIKDEDYDSVPSYYVMHDLFKNKSISSLQTLKFLEEVFLRSDLPVTSTLWKSALENIMKRIKGPDKGMLDDIETEIAALYEYYPHLILDDMTTRIYLLNIYSGERLYELFNWIQEQNVFLTVLELSQLIIQYDLFVDDMESYISYMKRYHILNTAMHGNVMPSDTYGHFLKGCISNYDRGFVPEMKRDIVELSKYATYSPFFKNMSEDFCYMADDLKESLGNPVVHLERLLH